ncbi:MAG TPA: hypothetical protein VFI59_15800 [Actinomycetota bacterium]|nr:hypothetical protein [Actinomycetota bacterium]
MKRTPMILTAMGLMGLLVAAAGTAQAAFPGKNGQIAFDTDGSGHSQIFTVRPDGTGVRQLTHFKGRRCASQPKWSADGRHIVFAVKDTTGEFCSENGNGRIWVMNADGTGQHRVMKDPGFDDTAPAWSPDGDHIVFSRCARPFGFATYCDIARVDADGTGLTKLLGGNWVHNGPSYSPDGQHISFSANRGGMVTAIWVMDADGGGLHRLTEPALEASGPKWSPDGSTILFDTIKGIPDEIVDSVWVMTASGSDPMLLNDHGVAASYSPNGRRIVLLSGRLSVMNADGTDLHTLVRARGIFSSDWQPRVAS